ncbi:MAG: penicillin acylase family protein, partial [Chloroflexi bacterium]|nr:penicillin acylase family protein [Chloroflexota bacterium]
LVRRPFPQINGTISLLGLKSNVEVYRDSYGVPHIYADSTHDLFFAQGYVHAQDRFWQMEFWRRIGAGRLSEVLGDGTLDTDRFLRMLGWARVAAA